MIESIVSSPKVLERLRAGVAWPYLQGFAEELVQSGYSATTVRRHLEGALHLGQWATGNSLAIETLSPGNLNEFRQHIPKCRCVGCLRGMYPKHALASARLFLGLLARMGVLSPAPFGAGETEPALLVEFKIWMQQHRGATEATLITYARSINGLIHDAGGAPSGWTPGILRAHVLKFAENHSPKSTKAVVTAIRVFLRFLGIQGYCSSSLVDVVPTVVEWRLAALPRSLPAKDVEDLLASCSVASPGGIRDRAILLILCRLGLRAGEVADLRFKDLDWDQGTIRVTGKARRESLLPLPQDVGEAILLYLEQARPSFENDHVFIRTIAPTGPIQRWGISCIVGRALARAGITGPSKGAHMLRHSAACALLREGSTLNAIAVILRHRSLETTALYAKVDLESLKSVVQPWPGGAPC